jgi:hypothetical protein
MGDDDQAVEVEQGGEVQKKSEMVGEGDVKGKPSKLRLVIEGVLGMLDSGAAAIHVAS